MTGRETARPRVVGNLIEEYLPNPLIREKGKFLWSATVCVILWALWGEWNNKILRGVERDPKDLWSLVHYHVSLWVSLSKAFCNYSLGLINLSWDPFL